ncbi:myelin basic protein-like isoform X1 [Carassius carassius]|uniref:myelin basic protein-like isoform X1 n=1 Tax=Carassius carassius TaxID=217509 RepID=UPI0028684FE1|nr:myelin basic protein-like isoform X1 [Carassius carassius]
MGQHLGKREPLSVPKGSSTVSEHIPADSPVSQDEVFGLGEADLNQNNGCSSKSPVVTDSMNAAVDHSSWNHPSTADPDASGPRPHMVRLFSRDAPGREDNTFKHRPSESDELQTIQEHSGAGSECGSDCAE